VTAGGNGWCDGQGAAQCPDPNEQGLGALDCAYTAGGAVAAGDRACDALAGYDGPTGVGTPNGSGMFAKTGPSVDVSGPSVVTQGHGATFHAKAIDPFPGGFAERYVWKWGDGASTTTTTGSASHVFKNGGVTRTVTVTVTDNYGATGSGTHPVKVGK
jgi:hypothetical protein